MLELDAITYRYAGARTSSLDGLSLGIRDGEVVGLVGASESGKSTTCLVASGLAPRVVGGELRGVVRIDGVDTTAWPIHEFPQRVGIAFQNPASQLSGVCATVYEEVAFGPANMGLPRSELVSRTTSALMAVGIADLAMRDPARLSGGQMQLVAVAGLIALRPAHLVLDEPMAQLDPAGRRLVADALRRVARDGLAILVAEHDTDLLAEICDRVVALDGGRSVLDGAAKDVLSGPELESLGVAPPSPWRLARALREAGLQAEVAPGT